MQEEINKTTTLIECRSSSGGGMPLGGPSGMPPGGLGQEIFMNETVVDYVCSIDGVKDVVEFLEVSSEETTSETISGPGGRNFTISRPVYTITGVSLNSSFIDSYSVLPTNVTAGRNLHEGDSDMVLMTSNLTAYFGIEVGDEVEIYGESFMLVGICEPASEIRTGTGIVYMNISEAQRITGNTGNVSRLDIYAENVSQVGDIVTLIEAEYSELSVTTYEDRLANLKNMQEMYTTTLENAENTINQTQAVATQEIIVAVVATSLIVLFVMLYTVRERTKEIGTLKAIGFSNWNVMSQFMLEGTILSLVAGVVGIAIGSVGAPILSGLLLPQINPFASSSPFGRNQSTVPSGASGIAAATLSPELMLLALGAAMLLGALGSLYPSWRASRTRPAEAMRYE
jgi:putative ABC transport system permease protein